MVDLIKTSRLKPLRDRLGKRADAFLIFLSVASVLLVFVNELMPAHVEVAGFELVWTDVMHRSRALTWLSFVAVFLTLGLTSHRSLTNYTRKWWLEAVIIIVWNPWFTSGGFVETSFSVFSMQTLLMIGMVAHVARVARWIINEFPDHPLIAVGAACATVLSAGSVLLMIAEPSTYRSFQDSLFSVYLSALTLGGPLVAQSGWGRIAECLVVGAGVSIWAVYHSVIREYVHRFLFKEGELLEKIWGIVDRIHTHMSARTEQLDRMQRQLDAQGEVLAASQRQLFAQLDRMQEQLNAQGDLLTALQKEVAAQQVSRQANFQAIQQVHAMLSRLTGQPDAPAGEQPASGKPSEAESSPKT